MARDGFVVYHELIDFLTPYGDAERGRIFTAMLTYSMTGESPGLSGNERFIWPAIKSKIDRDKQAYDERCETNRNNRQRSLTNVDEPERNAPTGTRTRTRTRTETGTRTNNNTGDTRFVPPDVEEVKAYCLERGNSVDAQSFVDFYSSKGWMIGKNKMKDWKAAVRTWERSKGKNKNDLSDTYRMMEDWANG